MHVNIIGNGVVGTAVAECFRQVGYVINGPHPDVTIIAVATPSNADGSLNTAYVKEAVQSARGVVLIKSTVPVGTCRSLQRDGITIVSNPEFLRAAHAVEDCMNPDRIVVGNGVPVVRELYRPWIEQGIPYLETDLETAEMIKLASNAYLAVRLSFINEIGGLCDRTGADSNTVMEGMGMDKRIGKTYLEPRGPWGGACLPKDTKGLLMLGNLPVLRAAVDSNNNTGMGR